MGVLAKSHRDLEVHERAFELAMQLFRLPEGFPKDEQFSLTNQVRRSSRSVTANIAEGWAKRRYQAVFVAKLTDALGELAETQEWIHYACHCAYLAAPVAEDLLARYAAVERTLSAMTVHSAEWRRTQSGYRAARKA